MKKGLLLLVVFLLVGCSAPKAEYFMVNHDDKFKEQQQDVEAVVKNDKHIRRVAALFSEDAAIIGIEVKPASKWNKQKYEKEWQKELEKTLPNHDVLVSTDLKIIWEAEKLAKQKLDDQQLKEKIKKLKDLSKEET